MDVQYEMEEVNDRLDRLEAAMVKLLPGRRVSVKTSKSSWGTREEGVVLEVSHHSTVKVRLFAGEEVDVPFEKLEVL